VAESFKDAMSRVPTSVSILSVHAEGEFQACTISSLISVEVETPKVLFVLQRNSSTLKALHSAKFYSVNVLSESQAQLALKYASNSKPSDANDWTKGLFETLDIKDSWVHFACQFEQSIELENSVVVISRVIDHRFVSSGKPLIYCNRTFSRPTD
jgi:flavin reductase (DIM6/NTAB) family NADH-FMN oxidoreductase RutF